MVYFFLNEIKTGKSRGAKEIKNFQNFFLQSSFCYHGTNKKSFINKVVVIINGKIEFRKKRGNGKKKHKRRKVLNIYIYILHEIELESAGEDGPAVIKFYRKKKTPRHFHWIFHHHHHRERGKGDERSFYYFFSGNEKLEFFFFHSFAWSCRKFIYLIKYLNANVSFITDMIKTCLDVNQKKSWIILVWRRKKKSGKKSWRRDEKNTSDGTVNIIIVIIFFFLNLHKDYLKFFYNEKVVVYLPEVTSFAKKNFQF